MEIFLLSLDYRSPVQLKLLENTLKNTRVQAAFQNNHQLFYTAVRKNKNDYFTTRPFKFGILYIRANKVQLLLKC